MSIIQADYGIIDGYIAKELDVVRRSRPPVSVKDLQDENFLYDIGVEVAVEFYILLESPLSMRELLAELAVMRVVHHDLLSPSRTPK